LFLFNSIIILGDPEAAIEDDVVFSGDAIFLGEVYGRS